MTPVAVGAHWAGDAAEVWKALSVLSLPKLCGEERTPRGSIWFSLQAGQSRELSMVLGQRSESG